jgi:CRP-like cAMP-binding protein
MDTPFDPDTLRDMLGTQVGEADMPAFLEHATRVDLAPTQVLVHDQADMDALYLLLEGRLALSVEAGGHTIQLGEIAPGNWVGEVALFSGVPKSASRVEAVMDSTLLRLAFADFRQLVDSAPQACCRLTHALIAMLIQRLRATANDPILDHDGQLLLLGQLSVPLDTHAGHHGIRDFLRSLLGVH